MKIICTSVSSKKTKSVAKKTGLVLLLYHAFLDVLATNPPCENVTCFHGVKARLQVR